MCSRVLQLRRESDCRNSRTTEYSGREVRPIVQNILAEALAYIAAAGNIVEYGKRLTERQDAEIVIYERAKADFEAARTFVGTDPKANFIFAAFMSRFC